MCDGFSFTLHKLRRKRSYLLGVGPNQSVRVGGGGRWVQLLSHEIYWNDSVLMVNFFSSLYLSF